MSGENLDLSSDPTRETPSEAAAKARRFVGVRFACCGVYARVYINRDETAYEGFCPKCVRKVRLSIGAHGTDRRFFTAY
jgi:hypothetical protein